MRRSKLFWSQTEVKGTWVNYLQMVIIHSYGNRASSKSVVSMTNGISNSFPKGKRWVEGVIFSVHFSRNFFACYRHMVVQEVLGTSKNSKSMIFVPAIICKFSKTIMATESSDLNRKLGIGRIKSVASAIQCNGSIKEFIIFDKF